jgi:hypothetical protein
MRERGRWRAWAFMRGWVSMILISPAAFSPLLLLSDVVYIFVSVGTHVLLQPEGQEQPHFQRP